MILPDLKGKHAIVTGAADGIGRALVLALLDQGVQVSGVDIAASDLSHANYDHHRLDLADAAAIEAWFASLDDQGRAIDYVVNIAGIDPKYSLEEAGAQQWQSVMDLNLRAYYLLVHHALAGLKRGVGKSIVNVSSINYRLGIPGRSMYAASKAGICGLTTGLARELGAAGIRINTVTPGWVLTPRQREEYFETADEELNARHRQTLQAQQSLALHIEPGDVANHIMFYLSQASRASTGHNCVVDAGWILE